MLPGFRFLFAATLLTTSILVFGLGAVALLRAAHEEFVNLPARRAAAEPRFAQPSEPPTPLLAMLRVEPAPPDENQKTSDTVSASAAPSEAADTTPAETAKSEIPASEPPRLQASADTPAPVDETKNAAAEQVLPPAGAAATPPAPEQTIAAATADTDAAMKIATLDPPTLIQAEPKAASIRSDPSVDRKRKQSRRARERRRLALRARLARQTAYQRPPADAFSQPTITARSR
jgi:hypothetical protein